MVRRRKTEDKRWHDYTNWMMRKINFYDPNYTILIDFLNKIPFIWTIEMDQNRASDGLYLRKMYYEDRYFDENFMFGRDVSVLEVLVALAIRMDNEYVGDPGEPNPGIIFLEFLENLGLDSCVNANFSCEKCEKIIEIWLKRRFNSRGIGSIFPIKKPKRDQRRIEIWSQMQEYIMENY